MIALFDLKWGLPSKIPGCASAYTDGVAVTIRGGAGEACDLLIYSFSSAIFNANTFTTGGPTSGCSICAFINCSTVDTGN